jgi:hypothetical protein
VAAVEDDRADGGELWAVERAPSRTTAPTVASCGRSRRAAAVEDVCGLVLAGTLPFV